MKKKEKGYRERVRRERLRENMKKKAPEKDK
jgi:hypothetical protein